MEKNNNAQHIKLYDGKIDILFEEKDWRGNKIHCYTKDNGEKPISVTQVTGTIDKSNFLIPWATRLMGEYLLQEANGKIINESLIEIAKKEWRKAKEEAADIGTMAHDWIEQYLKGKKPEMPESDKAANCVNAFLQWESENKIKWICNEKVVYSIKHDYIGKLDAVAKIKGKTYLIDYKSSKAIYPEFSFQTAAYQLAYEEEYGKTIDGRLLLHLGKETGEFEHREINGYKEDADAFIGLLKTKKRLVELNQQLT